MEIYRHLDLPYFSEATDLTQFRDITNGAPAETVFKKIIQTHKQIKTFSVFSYDLRINSDDDLQSVGMRQLPRKDLKTGSLYRLSNQIYKKVSPHDSPTAEEQVFGIGIASSVVLKNGIELHIPMLDFASRSKLGATLDITRISDTLKSYPGYLLETGDSLHFWGVNLLSQQSWIKFLDFCSTNFKNNEIDPSFISYSRQRGFSGLRIFSYGKVKRTTPYVVAKVENI